MKYLILGIELENIIEKEQALRASMQPLESINKKKNKKIFAPYFIEEVRRNIIDKYGNVMIKKFSYSDK